MRLMKENTLGIVIDIQEKLLPAMSNQETLISNCSKLIGGMLELGLPLLVTQQYTKGLGNTVAEIASCFPVFEPIEKTTFSCYDEPGFVERIEDLSRSNVIVCGIESHVCVMQTAIDLKMAGYNPVVIADAISSRKDESKAIAMERFRYEGIMVSSVESVLFELLRSASSAHFKSISKLVK